MDKAVYKVGGVGPRYEGSETCYAGTWVEILWFCQREQSYTLHSDLFVKDGEDDRVLSMDLQDMGIPRRLADSLAITAILASL